MEKPVSPREGRPITLSLSGTPFNLYSDYSPSEIFTWDYVKEQQAKANWHIENGDDPNPYDVLPRLNIFNLDIEDTIGRRILEPGETEENCTKDLTDEELEDEYAGFNFSNFFKVWDKNLIKQHGKPATVEGSFVHELEIMEFFYSLAKETSADSNFPYSTPEFRKAFKHTFWLIPGVTQGKALEELLKREKWEVRGREVANPYFRGFRVINAAGSEQEDLTGKALQDVKDHIAFTKGKMPERYDGVNPDTLNKAKRKEYYDLKDKIPEWKGKYTITLSCGKLTTGVSVPDWTAVFYMKGNDSTSASTYMQTIFRVQTPAVIDGAQKTECYVFDFSPVRSLKVFADAVRLNMSSKLGNDKKTKYSRDDQKEAIKEWLEFLPFEAISVPTPGSETTRMEAYDADKLFSQLDAKLIDRVVRSGYADNSIYDSVAIMELAPDAEEALARISLKISADSKSNQDGGEIKWGKEKPKKPTKRQQEAARNASGKNDNDLTPEEIAAKKAVDQWNKQRRERMKTLRSMSVRIPLLMYGAEISNLDELEISNFTSLVDDASWAEYMPPYITKADFDAVRDCYDSVRFKGSAEKIRDFARTSDTLSITDRVKEVARIFSFFHNPDKETVLTPWRVVNMHMADTIGGYRFFDDDNRTLLETPVKVEHKDVTESLFVTPDSGAFADLEKVRILEINSKTGLYPLYVAYSLFRARKDFYEAAHALDPNMKVKEDHDIWEETLKENIFVVCKTPMAVDITRRTLAGFTGNKVNAVCPTWEVPETILNKAGIVKLDKGQKPDETKLIKSDLVDVLRAKEEIEKENKSRVKRGEMPLDLIFTDQVQQRTWWEKALHRQLDHNKFNNDMIKFNAVVGNPPYHIMDGGGKGNSGKPIYNLFVDSAKALDNTIVSMITPSRWFVGGKGLSTFRDSMLSDSNISKIIDFPNYKEIFPSADIAGGVSYFLRLSKQVKSCEFHSNLNESESIMHRSLNEFEVLVRDNTGIEIIRKIWEKCAELNIDSTMADVVSIRMPFGISSTYKPLAQGTPCWFKQSVGLKHVKKSDVIDEQSMIDKWKLLIPFAPIAGQTDFTKPITIYYDGNIREAKPGECCSETYLVAGAFDTVDELRNFKSYLKSKLFRFLLLQSVISQNITREYFRFVPDFKEYKKKYNDETLRKLWDISKEQWDYIDSRIIDNVQD